MDKYIALICLSIIVFGSCNFTEDQEDIKRDETYKEYRGRFDSSLVNNFPQTINSNNVTMVCNTDTSMNNVGLLLYEYSIAQKDFDSLKANIPSKSIARYKIDDTCLLIVNRFDTGDYFNEAMIPDSARIDKPCSKSHYPIPLFNSYKNDQQKHNTSIKLDSTFNIYVLDAKPGSHFPRYKMKPDSEMPKAWQNGYSKGVALSFSKRIAIFWSIIW